jgi:galactosamine-6-phosphate isomerase
MQLVILETYNELCKRIADDLLQLTASLDQPLICPASGDTPLGVYHELVKRVNDKKLSMDNWNFVGLDEWMGLSSDDEGSCRNSLDKAFFHPLNIPETHISFLDGKSLDPKGECRNAEVYIQSLDGIDVALLGLGMNGHIAMNEPGTPKTSRAHISFITKETQEVGQKYFKTPTIIKEGLTLGIGTLLEAKHIMLMVTGSKKAAIVKRLLSSKETEDLPASFFLSHPHITIYLDKEAASLLEK